jgi:hypothetical protein
MLYKPELLRPLAPRNVKTKLNFCENTVEDRPWKYVYDPPEGTPKMNLRFKQHEKIIHDARGTDMEKNATLDETGFQFVKHVSKEKDFVDHAKIEKEYYPEIAELVLKTLPGAKRVFIWDHTVRREPKQPEHLDWRTPRGPAITVHGDQTFQSSVERVRRHLPEEAERLLKSRVRIINVWRPIQNPVAHNPLALGEWGTVDVERDLLLTRRFYPTFQGSAFNVREHPDHRFWYLSDQRPDECTFIKVYDSVDDGKTCRVTVHSAFYDDTTPPQAPQRQSIEARCIVFDTE